ncbi:MAG: hypothetical protein BRD50_02565 [Bacteroidetes bacterium SW_11_45_7]|nr:MAG: hypothetical protein BRD50_02565 [Bacteroidetes bacterium SW_11_45_7]
MKKLFFILFLFVGLAGTLQAQQLPLYSQYNFTPFLHNPAQTGMSENVNAYLIYRKQWVTFPGAPQTGAAAVDAPVSERFGLGGYLYTDQTDMHSRMEGDLSAAYHLPLGKEQTLSLGLAAGVIRNSLNRDDLDFDNPEEPILQDGYVENGTTVNAAAGLNYTFKGLQVGVSVPQIVELQQTNITSSEKFNYQLSRHYYATASYDLQFGENKWGLRPSAMMRANQGDISVDGNLVADYKDIVWLGVGYRYDFGIMIHAGFQIMDRVKVGYTADIATNDLGDYSKGSHEVMVGITFGQSDKQEEIEKKLEELEKEQQATQEVIDSLKESDEQIREQQDSLAEEQDEIRKNQDTLRRDQIDLEERQKKLEEERRKEIDSIKQEIKDLSESMDKDVSGATQMTMKEDIEYKEGPERTGFFEVVASFRGEKNAEYFYKQLKKDGYDNAGIVYNSKRKWHYVYIEIHDDLETSLEKMYNTREETDYDDAWIHIIQ